MKRQLMTGLLTLFTAATALADSITFTETLTETLVTERFEGFTEYFEETTIGATLNASITVEGLRDIEFIDEDVVELTLGGLSFFFSFSDAEPGATQNRATFIEVIEDEEDFREIEVGRLTFSRSGNVLTITATRKGSSIVADQYQEEVGPFSDTEEGIEFSLSVSSLDPFSRQLYYSGNTTITTRRVGSGESAETFELSKVTVNGAADYTAPKVMFVSPRANALVSNETVTVTLKATDNASVSDVFVSVNGDDFSPAEPDFEDEDSGEWTAELFLTPGMNTIRAYALDRDENRSTTNSLKVTYILVKPLELAVSPGGKVTGATNGQLFEVNKTYKLTAKPDLNFFFREWTVESPEEGTSTTNSLMLSFRMEEGLLIRADFVTNKFIAIKGAYNGLFAPTNSEGQPEVALTNSGFITLMLTDKGRITGKLNLAGKDQTITGNADVDGLAHLGIAPRGQSAITLDLVFDTDEDGTNEGVVGTVSRDGWVAAIRAVPAATSSAPFGSPYTFLIPGGDAEEAVMKPAGDGAGTAKLSPAGLLTLTGELGDGAMLPGPIAISKTGEWPFYKSLYGGKGFVWGWGQLSTNLFHLTVSNLHWIKLAAAARDNLYTNGFSLTNELLGARYTPPPAGSNAVSWPGTNGFVMLDGGNLAQTISNRVGLANNKVAVLDGNTNKVTLTIAPATGVITGNFTHPQTKKSAKLKGVLVQLPLPEGLGGGWFLGTNSSGYLRLEAATP